MKEEIRKRFIDYKEDLLKDLGALVAINSIRGEEKEGAPFGEEPLKALLTALDMGEKYGFKIDNVDNYAGSIEYGDNDEAIAILAHLDIVPAGKGWATDPFTLVEKDGRIYGRGVADDKGAVISALYAMRVLRDMGLPIKKNIKLIVGTNEEQGSGCMRYYAAHREAPEFGFTPDADYPLIHGEKGNLWTYLKFPPEKTAVLEMKAGEAFNAVPSECVVKLDGKQVDAKALKASIREEDTLGYPVEVSEENGVVTMMVRGLAAHGSTPQQGVNAAVSAATILCRYLGDKAGKMMFFMRDVIGREPDGKTYGVNFSDEISGSLSLNMGLVNLDQDHRQIGIDIRYPVSSNLDYMMPLMAECAEKHGLEHEFVESSNPHYIPKDAPIVQKLMAVYKDVTGETDAEPFVIGGGTYAKALGKSYVAFGPEFPGREPANMHNVNEQFVLEDYWDHCVICAMALYALAK